MSTMHEFPIVLKHIKIKEAQILIGIFVQMRHGHANNILWPELMMTTAEQKQPTHIILFQYSIYLSYMLNWSVEIK